MDKLKQRFSANNLSEDLALKELNNIKSEDLKMDKRDSKKSNLDFI
jgi:hypothetical protein